VRVSYGSWDGWVIFLAFCMWVPVMGCLVLTLVQQRRSVVRSFKSWPLVVAAILIAASVLAICVLDWVGAALDFLLVPAAGAFLVFAWVQPRRSDRVLTAVFGVVLTPLIAWFAGRADEYMNEGVIAAAFIVAIVASLAYFRRQGSRLETTMGSPPPIGSALAVNSSGSEASRVSGGHHVEMVAPPTRRSPALVGTLIIVALVSILVAGVGYAVVRNNHDMGGWRSKFYATSTIDGAELIDKGSRFGLQPETNGNHCDREAWLVYRTDLEPDVIEAHLAQTLDPTDGEWWVTPDPDSGTLRVDYWYRFDPGFDPRCN
jgi:hypothetical protein